MKNKLFIILLFITSFSWSQDYGKDISKILEKFYKLESYSIKAEVYVTGEENYSFSASVKNSKFGSYFVISEIEMLVNSNYSIVVDHEDKTIKVQKGDFKTKNKGKEELGLEMIEKSINETDKIKFLGETNLYKTYSINNNDRDEEKTIVKINKKTGFFHEIQVVYNDEDISITGYTVKYTEYFENPVFKKEDFDEKKIIQFIAGGKIIPAVKYKGYQVTIES